MIHNVYIVIQKHVRGFVLILYYWTVTGNLTEDLAKCLHRFLLSRTTKVSWKEREAWCLGWTASPLVSFQLPSAESRFTLRAMARRDPVWRAWTTATELTPAATPRTTLPSKPGVFPRQSEQALPPGPDLHSASDRALLENLVTGLRVKPTAGGFRALKGLPGGSTCLNLTPAPWKWARARERGILQCGNRLDICSAICGKTRFNTVRTDGCDWRCSHSM